MNEEIKDFFRLYVFGWMYSDVGICEQYGASFGGVALICAYIDFMGKLYLGITEDRYAKKGFVDFIDEFFDNKYKQFSKFIYSDYRCGLLHQFFPKRGAGVTRGEANREYHLIIDKENGLIPINLTVFFEDFKKALNIYYKKLLEDSRLQDNFNKVYQSMKNEVSKNYLELLVDNKDSADTRPAMYRITTSTIISGAQASSLGVGVSLNRDSYTSRMPQPVENDNKGGLIRNDPNQDGLK